MIKTSDMNAEWKPLKIKRILEIYLKFQTFSDIRIGYKEATTETEGMDMYDEEEESSFLPMS